jgi:fructose-1,6-bisphosphatase/inositol monophosphatase family enzyme
MIRSPLMTVMTDAVTKAARSLKRDFGEVENLQVSRKGPGNFVSAADHKAEKILRDTLEKARPGYGFVLEERGSSRARTRATAGTSTRSTARPTSCTASRISASRSASSAKTRSSRA